MSSSPHCHQVRDTRLRRTPHHGLVAVIRTSPQHYEIRKDGVLLGTVIKFQHWFARPRAPDDGREHRSDTMGDCVDWLSYWHHNYGNREQS